MCCKKGCQHSPLNCIFCLMQDHTECNKYMIKIDDIKNERMMELENWYEDAIMTGIAELANTFKKGNLGSWYNEH